jgi:outer membrane protein assembly factor BamA
LLLTALLAPVRPAAARDEAPTYTIESIRIEGNSKTKDKVILGALQVSPGDRLSVDDPLFELSRYRVLSLGFFSDVRLSLEKGSRRGRVILVVQVVERGTIVLSDLFLGSSKATAVWGGLGLAENNFLGWGVKVHGSFVIGTSPDVEKADLQHSYRLRVGTDRLAGGTLSLSGSFLYLDGSEFFRQSGPPSSADPNDFIALRYRRIGGTIGLGFDLGRFTRMYIDYRGEHVESDRPPGAVYKAPDGTRSPIDFGISDGSSVLSLFSLSVERDTRSDPVLPSRGSLLSVTSQFSVGLVGSSYDYLKLTALYMHYFTLKWGHIISPQVQGGIIFGDAPFFERFFIGDYNDLVPSRALGLNFSTQPSRNFFGTSINEKRYEEFAVRASVEYIIPWFRGGKWKFFYGGDFFFNVGLIMLTSKDELRVRDDDLSQSIPVDMTIDTGLRLDTQIGIFKISVGNLLGRIPL